MLCVCAFTIYSDVDYHRDVVENGVLGVLSRNVLEKDFLEANSIKFEAE